MFTSGSFIVCVLKGILGVASFLSILGVLIGIGGIIWRTYLYFQLKDGYTLSKKIIMRREILTWTIWTVSFCIFAVLTDICFI